MLVHFAVEWNGSGCVVCVQIWHCFFLLPFATDKQCNCHARLVWLLSVYTLAANLFFPRSVFLMPTIEKGPN